MSRMTTILRDFTIAAYSLGHSVTLTETPPPDDRPWEPFRYRCTWRRTGPLGSGEYREVRVSQELVDRVTVDDLLDVLQKNIVRPLIGDDLGERIGNAARELAAQFGRRGAPVEFYGGPKDGDVWTVRVERDGFPLDHLVAVVPTTDLVAFDAATSPEPFAPAMPKALYRRGTLDEERGVWRYDFQGPA